MKRIIVATILLLAAITASAKKDWKGKVVDEKGEPVAYANVAVLSKVDSTVVCGTVTEEDGTFNIVADEKDGIMMVAILGYKTIYLAPVDGALITIYEDATLLEGAAVQAIMPKTKLTGEGLQTNVRGSVLENAGTASDVLAKTPGLIKRSNGLEVIGKGAPLVYINGHKVTDSGELDRLQSNEIQSIEVITNPDSQYDATVRSVVRIRTIRRQGDGFGFNLDASDAQSLRWNKGNDPNGSINANYRTGGVDIFAGVNYQGNTSRQLSYAETASYGTSASGNYVFENKGDIDAKSLVNGITGNAGVNWQIADNHFVGGKMEWGRQVGYNTNTYITGKVYENDKLVDDLVTVSDYHLGDLPSYNIGGNMYYNGTVGGKLGIDVNLDYYCMDSSQKSMSNETSTMTHDAAISSVSYNSSRLYAAKAVLSYPIWMGQLQVGTEETFSRRKDNYSISGIDIPASEAAVSEDNIAGFASYGFYSPNVGQMKAGVRYEYVNYDYSDARNPSANLSRPYSNWFPTFSYANTIDAGAMGPVQVMLNYSAKTRRPDYDNLSSAIRYNTRYIWQSGNAMLQPELSHNISVAAVWKWISLMLNYTRTNDAIMAWSSPFNEDGVVLVRPRNIDTPFRQFTAYAVFTPTIGPWTLNYTIGAMPQWLTINVPDPREPSGERTTKYNDKPVFVAQLLNTVTIDGGWQFELGGLFQTPGYSQNIYVKNLYFDLTAAVQKKLLKDGSLVLRIEGHDLAGMAKINVDTDFGSHTISQTNIMDTQKIKFSLRYSFNIAKSKYLGTGAGSDQKARM